MEDYTLDSDNIFSNPLFLVALEVELPKTEFPGLNIQYTGVGKINATYFALKAIKLYKPTIVINFGSAGSLDKNISGLDLVKYLYNYAETGSEYVKILRKIITQNDLTDFDNSVLMNSERSGYLTL